MNDQAKAFELRFDAYPAFGALVWMDASGHLHIKLTADNVIDIMLESSEAFRPRRVLRC